MSEDTLILREMTLTSFYQNRSSVINSILTGTQGVIFTRYKRPVAMLMPVPDAIKRRLDPGESAGNVVPFDKEDREGPKQGDIQSREAQ